LQVHHGPVHVSLKNINCKVGYRKVTTDWKWLGRTYGERCEKCPIGTYGKMAKDMSENRPICEPCPRHNFLSNSRRKLEQSLNEEAASVCRWITVQWSKFQRGHVHLRDAWHSEYSLGAPNLQTQDGAPWLDQALPINIRVPNGKQHCLVCDSVRMRIAGLFSKQSAEEVCSCVNLNRAWSLSSFKGFISILFQNFSVSRSQREYCNITRVMWHVTRQGAHCGLHAELAHASLCHSTKYSEPRPHCVSLKGGISCLPGLLGSAVSNAR